MLAIQPTQRTEQERAVLPPFDPWLCGVVAGDISIAAFAGDAGLADRRSKRLRALLDSAARRSRLYARLLKGAHLPAAQLQDLPVMRKRELMAQFDDWVSDSAVRFTRDATLVAEPYLGRYMVWESSGSTGEPGIFLQDPQAMAVYDALEALRRPGITSLRRMMDPWMLQERIVFVGATGGHFASMVSTERLRRIHPALSGTLHAVSFLQPLSALTAQLRALRPTIIATYPSAAVLLAEERLAGRLDIALNEVWTGGETLAASMRTFVGDAFGCPVTNNYGASEFLSLASECHCGRLHLNSDWAIIESVDDHGRAVPAGEAGATCLLTNLANHVQPIIRYDLGDRVTMRVDRCACGSHLPAIEVQGRCDDSLRLGASGADTVSVLPLALSTVLEDDAGLFDFQLVQESPTDLLLSTSMAGADADGALQRARAVLAEFLRRQGVTAVQIRCSADTPGQREPSGKIKRVLVKASAGYRRRRTPVP